ncbi:hypothetical protein ITP53_34300 [Nonomuraea sp. K274]|uniref:Uncharacterized protein n=1 Tax=Nonomuraea cypriaca TaxID=1187855 RepID=A0A931AKH6_9ACTN|nr:hypothetical protein [Nonomuraea cypriaca]MBF8190697.1 hypothetical protein [Nonomuraea cypriaca]
MSSGQGRQLLFARLLADPGLAVAFAEDPERFASHYGHDRADARALAGVDQHRLAVAANLALAKRLRWFGLHILEALILWERNEPGTGRLTRLTIRSGMHAAESTDECWSRVPAIVSEVRGMPGGKVMADLLQFEWIMHELMARTEASPVANSAHPRVHPDVVMATFGSAVTEVRRMVLDYKDPHTVSWTETHYLIRRQGDQGVRVRSIPKDIKEILESCDGTTAPSSIAKELGWPLERIEQVIAQASAQGLTLTGPQVC